MTTDRLPALLEPLGDLDFVTGSDVVSFLIASGVTLAQPAGLGEPVDECDHPHKPFCKDCQPAIAAAYGPAPDTLRAAAQAYLTALDHDRKTKTLRSAGIRVEAEQNLRAALGYDRG